jgi:hypothetical protein
MSESYRSVAVSPLAALERVATEAVLQIPGVRQIEPTFSQAVRELRRNGPTPVLGNGRVHLGAGLGYTNGTVEIGVTPDRSAYATAHDVRATLMRLLIEHGHTPGRITVTVLHLHDS